MQKWGMHISRPGFLPSNRIIATRTWDTNMIPDVGVNIVTIQSLKNMLDVNNLYVTYLQHILKISH